MPKSEFVTCQFVLSHQILGWSDEGRSSISKLNGNHFICSYNTLSFHVTWPLHYRCIQTPI
jgi:hypothetical protein